MVNNDQIETQEDAGEGVIETSLGGTPEFKGSAPLVDPLKFADSGVARPDNIPEKFWDPQKGVVRLDDLVKSYGELETKLGTPKGEAEEQVEEVSEEEVSEKEVEGEEVEEVSEEEVIPAADAPLATALADAQLVYAEKGELDAEARKPLLAAGVNDEQIDFYIGGVKAKEQSLKDAAAKSAGGSYENFEKAVAWAAENWTEKKIVAFNAQMGDVETVNLAVPGLMAAFLAANPGEGKLTNLTSGTSFGDVYTHPDQFAADLKKADEARDVPARRAAIAKQQRSLQAKSIKR